MRELQFIEERGTMEVPEGCDKMTDINPSLNEAVATKMFDEPLVASFWKNGKFMHLRCIDCIVNSGPDYTEIILRGEDETNSMFVITSDPEISASMSGRIFDGFQLKNAAGVTVERITTADNKTLQ